MLTIKCAKCGAKIFRYLKIGKGELHICIESRITKDFSVRKNGKVFCPKCGNLIGIESGKYIKLKKGSFTYSGTKLP